MNEYLVEIFDKHKKQRFYAYTIAKNKRQARKKILNERYIEASKRNKSYPLSYFIWTENNFKVRKAYEINEDVDVDEYRCWKRFGDTICLGEFDVFLRNVSKKERS